MINDHIKLWVSLGILVVLMLFVAVSTFIMGDGFSMTGATTMESGRFSILNSPIFWVVIVVLIVIYVIVLIMQKDK